MDEDWEILIARLYDLKDRTDINYDTRQSVHDALDAAHRILDKEKEG